MVALSQQQLVLLLVSCLSLGSRGAFVGDKDTEVRRVTPSKVEIPPQDGYHYHADDEAIVDGKMVDWHFHQDNNHGDNHGDGDRLHDEVPDLHDGHHQRDDTVVYKGMTTDRFFHETNHADDDDGNHHNGLHGGHEESDEREADGGDFNANSAHRNLDDSNGESADGGGSSGGYDHEEGTTKQYGNFRYSRRYGHQHQDGHGDEVTAPHRGIIQPSHREYLADDRDDDQNRAHMDGNHHHGHMHGHDHSKSLFEASRGSQIVVADAKSAAAILNDYFQKDSRESLVEVDSWQFAKAKAAAAVLNDYFQKEVVAPADNAALAEEEVSHESKLGAAHKAVRQAEREVEVQRQNVEADRRALQDSEWHSVNHHPMAEHIHGHVPACHTFHQGEPFKMPDNNLFVVHNGDPKKHRGTGVIELLHQMSMESSEHAKSARNAKPPSGR